MLLKHYLRIFLLVFVIQYFRGCEKLKIDVEAIPCQLTSACFKISYTSFSGSIFAHIGRLALTQLNEEQ